MAISINQSFYQRRESGLLDVADHFNFEIQSKDMLEACKLDTIINLKKKLSKTIGWYLKNKQKFGCKLDLNRKCRALGIPAFLSGINVSNLELEHDRDILGKKLIKHTRLKHDYPIQHCLHDIHELVIYVKMFKEILIVLERYPNYYPYGNPFEEIMGLINLGAVIIRFKYVKVGKKKPIEKLITYHLWTKKRLLIHIEGDNDFIGWKYWGEGDETIKFFRDDNVKIRWGIDDFNKKGKFRY